MAGFADAEQALLRELLKRVVKNLDDAASDVSREPMACKPPKRRRVHHE
jgi:hypothetical protein